MSLTITSIAAVLCAMIIAVQTFSVIKARRGAGIPFGDGGNRTLMKRIRGHANSTEQMPLFLILLGLTEYSGNISSVILAILTALFICGRVAHGYYFLDIGAHFKFRQTGMVGTMMCQNIMTVMLAISVFL